MRYILFTILILFYSGCTHKTDITPKEYWAKPVKNIKLENFNKVDEKLYRGSQPSAEQFAQLYRFGIRYDLNLRQFHDDADKLKNLDIKYKHIPTNASSFTYEQLVEAVAFLISRDKKTFVHCKHGSDRTGIVVAGYRIAANNWSKEKAIEEMTKGRYGYHSFWFPNLPKLLQNIDEKQFKNDVKRVAQKSTL